MTNGLGPIRVFVGIVAQPSTHWARIARSNRRFSKMLETGKFIEKARKFVNETRSRRLLEFARKHLKNPPKNL